MFLLHVYYMYEKDLICLFTVRKEFLTHFELSELLGLGKSENPHGKSLTKQILTGLSCARVTLVSTAVSKTRILCDDTYFDTCIVSYSKIIHRSLLFTGPPLTKKVQEQFKN